MIIKMHGYKILTQLWIRICPQGSNGMPLEFLIIKSTVLITKNGVSGPLKKWIFQYEPKVIKDTLKQHA